MGPWPLGAMVTYRREVQDLKGRRRTRTSPWGDEMRRNNSAHDDRNSAQSNSSAALTLRLTSSDEHLGCVSVVNHGCISGVSRLHLKVDVEGRVGRVAQVLERCWLVLRPRARLARERFERGGGHDPRRDGRGEVLGAKRAERHVLELLHITRRPVVAQHEAEDAVRRLRARKSRSGNIYVHVCARVGAYV